MTKYIFISLFINILFVVALLPNRESKGFYISEIVTAEVEWLVEPEIVCASSISGSVELKIYYNEKGAIIEAEILKSSGSSAIDHSALEQVFSGVVRTNKAGRAIISIDY